MESLDQTYKRLLSENKKEETSNTVDEELKGGQKNLDKNHNGKLDGQDFAILRNKKKKVVSETAEEPPFDKPYKTTKGVVTDKSGAKHGPMSRARDLARSALNKHLNATYNEYNPEKDKLKKQHFGMAEEVQIDEANHRDYACASCMHPTMAKHMTVGQHTDYYEPKTGNKVHGKVMHKSDTEVHMKQTQDSYDDKKVGSVHKFKIKNSLDEVLKPSMGAGAYIDDFVHSKNPKFAGKSSEKRRQMALAAFYAAKKGMKEEVEQLDEIGNTPAGREALKAVSDRGNKENSDWNKDSKSGFTATPKKVVKHFSGAMNADRRLSGQGISKGKEGQAQRQIDYAKKMRTEEVELDEKITVVRDPSKVRTDAPQGRGDVYVPTAPVPPKKKLPMRSRVGHPTNMKEDAKSEGGLKLLATLKANSHKANSHEEATTHLNKAKAEKEGSEAYHFHMSNHHEAMGHWHNSKGRSHSADQEYDKAEAHHGAWYKKAMKEEVEQIDELSKDTLKSFKKKKEDLRDTYRTDASHQSNDSDRSELSKYAKDAHKSVKKAAKKIAEAKDEKEYGYEGDMAMNQLKTLVRCAEMIEDCLKPDTDLPEWVQSKITLATDYIQTAADYLYSETEMNESTQNVTPTVKTDKYSWGTMKTIHHGSSFSIPLHPEHHEKIADMKDQQQHTIKTEDGRQYHVKREGDTVHFHGVNGGNKTSVPHKSLAEETQVDEAWVLRQKKKEKKPVKEETVKSFKDFITEMEFDKNGKYVHKGKYGTSYDDPEGKEDSEKPAAEKAEKRGRGRPAGAKSGARQIGGASKKGSGVEYTGYKLHLPNSNK